MRLVRMGSGSWQVLAVCDHRDRCQVVDFLRELAASYPAAAESMFSLLTDLIPACGPPKAEPLSKALGHGLYEFRKQPKGHKLRVIWFYGTSSTLVCTCAFSKAERTPQIRIEQSRLLRKQYLAAQFRRQIEIVALEEIP